VGPLRRGDQESLERFDTFFAQSDLLWLELSAAVVDLATSLRASHGLRTPDALQAACCLQLGPEAAADPLIARHSYAGLWRQQAGGAEPVLRG
jgi:predicted nucleic acid-binding protein